MNNKKSYKFACACHFIIKKISALQYLDVPQKFDSPCLNVYVQSILCTLCNRRWYLF